MNLYYLIVMSISIIKRSIFLGIVLAAKFNDDLRLNNNDFSKIGGISLDELFVLEICFLKSIKFNLRVSMEEFLSYLKNIIK